MLLRFSSRAERLGVLLASFRHSQEFRDVNGKRTRQLIQQIDAGAECAALQVADRGSVDTCVNGQRLLANASAPAEAAKIPSYSGTTLHRSQAINLKHIKPSDISDINKMGRTASRRIEPMLRHTRYCKLASVALFLVQISVVTAQDAEDFANPLVGYQGSWSINGSAQACEPGVYSDSTLTIGRFESTNEGPVFETGPLKLATLDGSCELHDPQLVDGKVDAVCKLDGQELAGRTTITGSGNAIQIQSPLGKFKLLRCLASGVVASPTPVVEPQPPSMATTLVSVTPYPSAQNVAIASIYRDHCQPEFAVEGSIDAEVYYRYRNQFFTMYSLDCNRFFREAVSGVLAERAVAALLRLPEVPSRLNVAGGRAAGMELFLDTHRDAASCMGDNKAAALAKIYSGQPPKLLAIATVKDFPNIIEGYRSLLAVMLEGKMQNVMFACDYSFMFIPTFVQGAIQETRVSAAQPQCFGLSQPHFHFTCGVAECVSQF